MEESFWKIVQENFSILLRILQLQLQGVSRVASATIPNHVHGSRNHLESLVESGNQVEILESRIIISTFILGYLVFFCILQIMWCTSPYLVNRNHKNRIRNLGIKPRIKIPESCRQKFRVADPSVSRLSHRLDRNNESSACGFITRWKMNAKNSTIPYRG